MSTTADYAGSSKARQEVGLPGHCDDCARVGHVQAHPDLGCGDVGCTRAHAEPVVRTVHTDPEHRRLTAAFAEHMRASTFGQVATDMTTVEHYELAAELALVARRLGWEPRKP